MSSSMFTHLSACIKWVSAQEGCVSCLRECVHGLPQQCVWFFHGVMRVMDWHYHPSHEHTEHAGNDTDPHFGIGHFDARLP
eukprot:12745938-Alexandrium_andersonii.AAC.1